MIVVIARLLSKGEIIGYRLLEYTPDKEGTTKDVSEKSLMMNVDRMSIANATLLDGKIVGKNGSLDRLPQYDCNKKVLVGKSPLIVLYRYGEVGFIVADYTGKIKKLAVEKVIEYSKNNGISNGKVVTKDGVEFISAINGDYSIVEPKRASGIEKLNKAAIVGTDSKSSVKSYSKVINNTGNAVKEEIEFNDVFKTMSKNQKSVIQEYYVWLTVEIYKTLEKGTRLNIPPNKIQQIAELKGTEDWHFGGVIDSGYFGGDKCSLGHTLRYVYQAVNYGEDGEKNIIKFGSTCSSDFFEISPEGLRTLDRIRVKMAEEIEIFSDITANKLYDTEWENVSLLNDMIKIWANRDGMTKLTSIFGAQLARYILEFIGAYLPYPGTLCRECIKKINKKFTPVELFNDLFPDYKLILDEIDQKNNRVNFWKLIYDYLEFIARIKIEGRYAYDPNLGIGDRGKGRFTKEAKLERNRTERRFYRLVRDNPVYNLDEAKAILLSIDNKYKLYNTINKKFGSKLESRCFRGLLHDKCDKILMNEDDYSYIPENPMLYMLYCNYMQVYLELNNANWYDSKIELAPLMKNNRNIVLPEEYNIKGANNICKLSQTLLDNMQLLEDAMQECLDAEEKLQSEQAEQEKAEKAEFERKKKEEELEEKKKKEELEAKKKKEMDLLYFKYSHTYCSRYCKNLAENGECSLSSFKLLYQNSEIESEEKENGTFSINNCKHFIEKDEPKEDKADGKDEKLSRLFGLLAYLEERDPDRIQSDHYLKIAYDIVHRYNLFDKLSVKQQAVVVHTINKLSKENLELVEELDEVEALKSDKDLINLQDVQLEENKYLSIAKDIINKFESYDDMSYKQYKLVSKVIKELRGKLKEELTDEEASKNKADSGVQSDVLDKVESELGSKNVGYKENTTTMLSDDKDTESKVDKIIEAIKSGLLDSENFGTKGISIINTIKSRGKYSTRQYKYVEQALEIMKGLKN